MSDSHATVHRVCTCLSVINLVAGYLFSLCVIKSLQSLTRNRLSDNSFVTMGSPILDHFHGSSTADLNSQVRLKCTDKLVSGSVRRTSNFHTHIKVNYLTVIIIKVKSYGKTHWIIPLKSQLLYVLEIIILR